jgi:hypothetical protein
VIASSGGACVQQTVKKENIGENIARSILQREHIAAMLFSILDRVNR